MAASTITQDELQKFWNAFKLELEASALKPYDTILFKDQGNNAIHSMQFIDGVVTSQEQTTN